MVEGATPRVSVVLPTYRRPDLLVRAVRSVQAQTLVEWELIVVDDNDPGSPERLDTKLVMSGLADDPRITYLEHDRNRGGSAARNSGIRAASAPLVAFLDDDDDWYPNKLELQVAHLESQERDVALVYCAFRRVAQDGATQVTRPDAKNHTLEALLTRNGVGTTSAIVCRRQALLAVGGFDEELPSRQDVDLYLRLAEKYRLTFVDDVLLDFHRHAGDAIGKNLVRALKGAEVFEAKHAELLAQHPKAAHFRLLAKGTIQRRAGQRQAARRTFRQAWRNRPLDARAVVGLLATTSAADLARSWRDSLKGRATLRG